MIMKGSKIVVVLVFLQISWAYSRNIFNLRDTSSSSSSTGNHSSHFNVEGGSGGSHTISRQAKRQTIVHKDEALHLLDDDYEEAIKKGSKVHVAQVGNADLTDDLKDWEPPAYIKENFPYYLLGYDDDNRPIWAAELGKMDLRGLIEERGKEGVAALEKYTKQVAYRIINSMKEVSTDEQPVTEVQYLIDFDGLEMKQLSYVPSLTFFLRLCRTYQELITKHLAASYIINANFLAENLIRLIKPIFGPAMARVEVYGTKKDKWMPIVRRNLGTNLPECYGGKVKQFKPIAFYG